MNYKNIKLILNNSTMHIIVNCWMASVLIYYLFLWSLYFSVNNWMQINQLKLITCIYAYHHINTKNFILLSFFSYFVPLHYHFDKIKFSTFLFIKMKLFVLNEKVTTTTIWYVSALLLSDCVSCCNKLVTLLFKCKAER
jgi:hypothetical protein